ncbi:MAG TPA: SRPBCC family protein, partial [Chitinolyticbacter sp.]|nr:SRPBCC family protein [Chitinolyticbacter sp.]
YGLAVRVVFALASGFAVGNDGMYALMSSAFLLLTPTAIGAITVYASADAEKRSWWYYGCMPWAVVTLFAFSSGLMLLEGLICIVMALPLFCLGGSVGGLLMGAFLRWRGRQAGVLHSFIALPLLVGALPGGSDPNAYGTATVSIDIAAPPAVVWQQLYNVGQIAPEEVPDAFIYRIGVPKPRSGQTVTTPEGRVRQVRWHKGVHFEEVVTDWQPERTIGWTYRFAKDSIPPGALDEHVTLGGRYFGLEATHYTLTPIAGGTRLTLQIGYRVSTDFNWYSHWLGQMALRDFAGAVLVLYRNRSEATQYAMH